MTYIPSFPAVDVNQIDTYRLSGNRYNTGTTQIGSLTIDSTWRYMRGLFVYATRDAGFLGFSRGEFVWDMQRWGNLQSHYYTFNGTNAWNNAGGSNWYARGYGNSSKGSILVKDTPTPATLPIMEDDIYISGYAPSTSPSYSQSVPVYMTGDTNRYAYASLLLIVYREV